MTNANVDFFSNAQHVDIGGNAQINVNNHADQVVVTPGAGGRTPIEILLYYSATGCLYNAADRFDPPKCAPETREKILRQIEKWVLEDKHGSAALMWLFGAAGAGKSAIAQTTVENCIAKGLHAGSFFFSRIGATQRSEAKRLLPTITYQVINIFPNAKPRIEKVIRDNPHLFDTSSKSQMEQLLIRPLKSKWYRKLFQMFRPPKARLVVIDGLDECKGIEQQKEILQMLAEALPLLPYPFRFLIVSRPEAHIMEMFRKHPAFKNISFDELDLSLDADADKSVENYLRQSFEHIRLNHRLAKDELGPEWPSQEAIDNIVKKASGQFIYASTVIKYVEHHKFFPHKRLQVILGLEIRPVKDEPFAQLNLLYMLIFDSASVEQWEVLQCLFGILYLSTLQQHKYLVTSPYKLESYLSLEKGELLPMLDDFLSLLQVFDDLTHPIKIYHASLFDFLLDRDRSKRYCLEIGLAHRRLAEFFMPSDVTGTDEVLSLTFLYHCEYADLSDSLKAYLEEFPLLYNPDSNLYWGYFPFIYHTYLMVLARKEFNPPGGQSWYSVHLRKLESQLDERNSSALQPVLPDLQAIDLGNQFSNDRYILFTKFVKSLFMNDDFPQPLEAICELARGGLKDWESTTITLKYIFLAALPICQPSSALYRAYCVFSRHLFEEIKDQEIDKAIKIRLAAFMKLPKPRGSERDWEACRAAWPLAL
ncbi:hypothetical protein CPB83DRAFT_923181 [Crepidotus variabilis]|uniref:Nephrocystin 3-like N-terminal domain-containing protein n=1 Tax=Crepidotus variabilis TaxID=179855 RepID=A0A9P6EJL5_9AGAR|nr:hypothetical protein CPB83DRAFT_923181 [Crepidotus variabilis]